MDLKDIMLCGIRQTEKDKYRMLSYTWNLNNNKAKTPELSQRENILVVARGEELGWTKWVEGVKRYKLPVIK